MDTALLEPGSTRTGWGRIYLIFGEFANGTAHILFHDGSTVHVHGEDALSELQRAYGSLRGAAGQEIAFRTDAFGVLLDFEHLSL